MKDTWYWPVLEAFRKHLELQHPDKGMDNHDEVRWFEEHLFYERFKNEEVQDIGCCWHGCQWHMKFAVKYELADDIDA